MAGQASNADLAVKVSSIVLRQFERLPKKGKPAVKQGNKVEWTVLAGIVEARLPTNDQEAKCESSKDDEPNMKCVALATGLKCLPPSLLSRTGDCLNDSHAEILCRRLLQLYLYAELEKALTSIVDDAKPSGSDVLEKENGKWRVREGITYHMYISQGACGDATMESLFSQEESEQPNCELATTVPNDTSVPRPSTSSITADPAPPPLKRHKPNPHTPQLPLLRGRTHPTVLSALRTKPGRRDAETTHSHSCSDKILQWSILGLASSLLSQHIHPIYLSSLCVAEHFDHQASIRAFQTRISHFDFLSDPLSAGGTTRYTPTPPQCLPAPVTHAFAFSKQTVAKTFPHLTPIPADASILWSPVFQPNTQAHHHATPIVEVLVAGRKQGFARKKRGASDTADMEWPVKSQSAVCKRALLERYLALTAQMKTVDGRIPNKETAASEEAQVKTYREYKREAKDYQEVKRRFKEQVGWAGNNGYGDGFTINTLPVK
ncbi:tRNA-specific adenosine deaminase 1 [Gaertneriomyces sp. JEL0708]|nr:tRNA-specific adenosine deaminase 1 [Gaertneriomyces sp. JEL0708]